MTEQALVAIGGNGSRLRAGGVEVPITKSFLEVADKPLLHWSLQSMAIAGVRRVVLSGDRDEALEAAQSVVEDLSVDFDEVKYHKDPGLGAHGLPYQALDMLEDEYFFEAGHNMTLPSHYTNMHTVKQPGKIVFSAFTPHTSNQRQPVHFDGENVLIGQNPHDSDQALSHPFLVDKSYAQHLPDLDFSIDSILAHYSNNQLLQWVHSDMPPEIDTAEEYKNSLPAIRKLIHITLDVHSHP